MSTARAEITSAATRNGWTVSEGMWESHVRIYRPVDGERREVISLWFAKNSGFVVEAKRYHMDRNGNRVEGTESPERDKRSVVLRWLSSAPRRIETTEPVPTAPVATPPTPVDTDRSRVDRSATFHGWTVERVVSTAHMVHVNYRRGAYRAIVSYSGQDYGSAVLRSDDMSTDVYAYRSDGVDPVLGWLAAPLSPVATPGDDTDRETLARAAIEHGWTRSDTGDYVRGSVTVAVYHSERPGKPVVSARLFSAGKIVGRVLPGDRRRLSTVYAWLTAPLPGDRDFPTVRGLLGL